MCHLPGPGEVSPPAPAAGQTGHGRRLKDSAFRRASWASCSLRGFYWAKTFSFCAFRHEKPQGTPGSHARSSPLSAAPPPHPPQGSGARAQPEADAQHPPRIGMTSPGGRNPASCHVRRLPGEPTGVLKGRSVPLPGAAAPGGGGPGLGRIRVCTISVQSIPRHRPHRATDRPGRAPAR